MKILIYGGRGWIGSYIQDYLKSQEIDYILGKERIGNNKLDSVEQEIQTSGCDRVLCLIGRTSGGKYTTIDYLEQQDTLNENITCNLFAPLSLAIICQQLGIHLSYMGTGCIFEFDEEHTLTNGVGFTADDLPNFFGSKYSLMKGFTDRLMHLFKRGILNIRIRMPITTDNSPKNFMTKITNYERVCSIPNSMTVLPELIPVMVDLINKQYSGTVNLVNPGLISHNEILELYRNMMDREFTWKNFTIAEQNEILLGKRSNNLLNTDFIEKEYPDVLGIRDSIIQVLQNLKNKEIKLNKNRFIIENKTKQNWIASKKINHKRVKELLKICEDTNIYTNGGPIVNMLEQFIREKFEIDDSKAIICVNNATAGLHGVISAINLYFNKETKWVTQSFTFPSSAQGTLGDVCILDIDLNTGGLSLEEVEKIKDDIDGIIITNIFGNVVDINKYTEWANMNNKFLVFDNAATCYTFYNNKNSCNYGNASVISFHHTKPFGFGEGGAIIIDSQFEKSVRRIINFGIHNEKNLRWNKWGSNYKMSEISACYILQYLEDNFNKIIEHHTKLYRKALELGYKMYPNFGDQNKCVKSCLCFFDSKFTKEYVQDLNKNGIFCRKYYDPLISTKNSNYIYENIMCYPCNMDIDKILI